MLRVLELLAQVHTEPSSASTASARAMTSGDPASAPPATTTSATSRSDGLTPGDTPGSAVTGRSVRSPLARPWNGRHARRCSAVLRSPRCPKAPAPGGSPSCDCTCRRSGSVEDQTNFNAWLQRASASP
jgi:hypothetical protein